MSKPCRHPVEYRIDRAIFRIGHDIVTTMRTWWADGERIAECEVNRCTWCGEWLPMGHSDETPERVALEIRAAKLAFNDGPIRTCDNSMPEDCEGCGWDCWPLVGAMHDAAPAQWAGYLARAIVEHDDKETP